MFVPTCRQAATSCCAGCCCGERQSLIRPRGICLSSWHLQAVAQRCPPALTSALSHLLLCKRQCVSLQNLLYRTNCSPHLAKPNCSTIKTHCRAMHNAHGACNACAARQTQERTRRLHLAVLCAPEFRFGPHAPAHPAGIKILTDGPKSRANQFSATMWHLHCMVGTLQADTWLSPCIAPKPSCHNLPC